MKNILSILADLANGIFAILLATYLTGEGVVWWYFPIGMALAMSPDIDAIPELLLRGRVAASPEHPRDHRTFLHYPMVSIPLGLLATWFVPFWGLVWLLSLVLHLINDLYGTGWGLPLLYPFTSTHYKFFCRRVNQSPLLLKKRGLWDTLPLSETRVRFFVSWNKTELPVYIQQYGMDDWIDWCYLRVNPITITEYSLFLIAIVLAVCSLLY
jgi:hypothetical protein